MNIFNRNSAENVIARTSPDKVTRINIAVPDLNDSVSRVVLSGVVYYIRFTYNYTGNYWSFGLYDAHLRIIADQIKIVPRFALNLYLSSYAFPPGIFGIFTNLDRVTRNDFKDGLATFAYMPLDGGI